MSEGFSDWTWVKCHGILLETPGSPAESANVEATVKALHIGLARVAELAVDLCGDLGLEHAGALVALRWLLIPL